MKKRLILFAAALTLLLPVLTVCMQAVPSSTYKYKVNIQTRDEKDAGTDSDIYVGFETYNDGVRRLHVDEKGNDFERDSRRDYYLDLRIYPWMIKGTHLHHDGGGAAPGWKPGEFKVWVPTMSNSQSPSLYVGLTTYSGTMTSGDEWNLDISSKTRRNFTSLGSFEDWGRSIYLGSGDSGTLSLYWNGKTTDQYGTYNIFSYDDAGDFSMSVSCNSGTTTLFRDNFTYPSGSDSGELNLSYSQIYDEMIRKGIGKITLKFTLSLPSRSSNAGSLFTKSGSELLHTETITIYRKCFEIGNVSYADTPVFYARQDNNYLNSTKRKVTITVSPTSLHCASLSTSQMEEIVEDFSCTAKLCAGNSTTNVITSLSCAPSSDGTKLVFTGTVPDNFTTNGAGVTLSLTGVSSKYNGVTYHLQSGSSSWSAYLSTLKIDSKKPTISITDKDSVALDISDTLAASHTFFVSGSETLYKSTTSPHPASDEAYLGYSLLDGSTKVSVTNYNGGSGSYLNVTVPVSTAVMPDLPITLKTAAAAEGAYTLSFTGYDDAGNLISGNTVKNVLLDSAAPRYTLAESKAYQDAQKVKHTEYNFTLDDFCNQYRESHGAWARLYYVFVPDGETVPEFESEAVTGEIETTIGRWNFVEADENGQLPTILLSLALNDRFFGDLYILTMDSVGNQTGVIKFASDLKIYNLELTDTLEASSNLVPKKSFDISFQETVSGFEGIFSTEYRWIPQSVDAEPITQSYIAYEWQDVGAGTQYGDDGKAVLMNGTYKLQYRVTEKLSHNTAVYEKNFIFDNRSPVVDLAWETDNSQPSQIQQATIVITDVSGVRDASYAVYTADGEFVQSGTLTPVVGGDGKVMVRETIKLQPSENGIYRLEIYATDVNGDGTLSENSAIFAIRRDKPVIISAGDDISVKLEGISVTPDQDYTVFLQIEEEMLCANALTTEQYVKYQVSADGVNYGPWILYDEPMSADDDKLSLLAGITSPGILTEGENTLYFRIAVSEKNNTADPSVSLISDSYSYSIVYDTTAPVYEIEHSTTAPTNEDVAITITAQDDGGVTSLLCEHTLITAETVDDHTYLLTAMRNVDTEVLLSDAVGNTVRVPILVTCIDKDAPVISAGSEGFANGARNDVTVTIRIEDANEVTTEFALIENPDEESGIDEEAFRLFDRSKSMFTIESVRENGVTMHTLILRGLDGEYGLAVKATDILGNTEIFRPEENFFTLSDAEPEILSAKSAPEISKTTAAVSISFNVPLFVLNPAIAVGETDEENEILALNQVEKTFVTEIERIVSDNTEKKLYCVDEAMRTCTLTFASDTVFIEGFKLTYELSKNGEAIENGGFTSFEEDDTVELVVTANPAYELQTFDLSSAVLVGYELDEEKSERFTGDPTVYAKLVFTALHDGTAEKSVSFTSYTAEGLETDRHQDEVIRTSVFDHSVPAVTFTPNVPNDTPTNQNVTLEVKFSDPESGVEQVQRITEEGVMMLNSKVRDSVEFSENGSVTYLVTNRAGMTAKVTYTVENIDKKPITEGEHYTVSYRYENYLGEWELAADGGFYRAVKAVVGFADCQKLLSVENNNTAAEVILNPERTAFTFVIRDSAGNRTEKIVSWETYDNDSGSIEWFLSNTEKTNKPVTAFVTITDKDNVNEIVYAEVRDAAGELYAWNDEVLGDEYSVSLPLSGSYVVTAYDAAGNRFTNQITVSNIDITKPVITRLSYSTPPSTITTRSVLVKIEEFSKSNVTVTGIERADNLGAYDVIYTPGSTEMRFRKSGYVSVFFVDDYGNENASVINVTNIYTDPPALEAVATLAPGELSVAISFKKQLDEDGIPVDRYRELEDLSVVYDGITYTTDKTFIIKQNGDYTFTVFDDAGTSQIIRLSVTDIDDRAPVIRTVSWSYEYLEENGGTWEKKFCEKTLEIGKDTSGTEAGYTVGPDLYKTTNSDVTVTVTTDRETTILGSNQPMNLKNSLIYAENGLFTFNLAAINGTVSSYGVDVEIIDKDAPELTLEGANELIFIEGMTGDKDPDFAYDKGKFFDYAAFDEFGGVTTDLTDRVEIDFGSFNPDDISANVFDRTKPYTVTYSVYDDAGNRTQLRRTVRLVGFYDTIALINGKMPNSANAIAVDSDEIEITLRNFSGTSYSRIAEGIFTMGQMKTLGEPITPYNGKLVAKDLAEGWYTVFIQTDKRDYFTITVYVNGAQ